MTVDKSNNAFTFNLILYCFYFKMVNAINSVLKEAKQSASTCKKKDNVPAALRDGEVSALRVILALLEPLATLTDDLQADGITSSLVIIGVINSINCKLSIY